MDENMDLNAKLDQLIEAVQTVVAKVDEQQARIDELDSALYDGLIGPANDAIAQNEYDNALSDFRAKYAEKLGPFENAAKAIEGDEDFDIYKQAFDAYNDNDYDFSPDEYIDKLASSLTEQVNHIKEVVAEVEGVKPEDVHVEVEGNEEGGVEVEVESAEDHKEEMETTAEEGETKEELDDRVETEVDHSDEDKTETETEAKTETEAEDESKGEETLEDFERSLKEEAEKDKDRSWLKY
jgi:hypothetical protein